MSFIQEVNEDEITKNVLHVDSKLWSMSFNLVESVRCFRLSSHWFCFLWTVKQIQFEWRQAISKKFKIEKETFIQVKVQSFSVKVLETRKKKEVMHFYCLAKFAMCFKIFWYSFLKNLLIFVLSIFVRFFGHLNQFSENLFASMISSSGCFLWFIKKNLTRFGSK